MLQETEVRIGKGKHAPIRKLSHNQNLCNTFYVCVMTAIALVLFVYMVFFPRSDMSERENRKLASFPTFSISSLLDGSYTSNINVFFSDTVPSRDELTAKAAAIKDKCGLRIDGVKIHNAKSTGTEDTTESSEAEENTETKKIEETTANVNVEDNATLGKNGILVAGNRGLMIFGGNKDAGKQYADVVNKYKEALGDAVNVYCVLIPTSIEFYCPPSYKDRTTSELESINNILGELNEDVKGVDVYTTLSEHSNEDIYFRTDHHWAPLGAYYAAESFAKVAKVDFPDLSNYEEVRKTGFVGTLYNFSRDIVLKENPEDFVYYKPLSVEYTTDYYSENNMHAPTRGEFFYEYNDGSPLLYGTFMGGDNHITHVHTNVGNGRKLAIFKDSYGNAFSPFMISSFEDVYVIDMRYFKLNSIEFMKEYGITDLAFVNNIFHADTFSTSTYYKTFMTQ